MDMQVLWSGLAGAAGIGVAITLIGTLMYVSDADLRGKEVNRMGLAAAVAAVVILGISVPVFAALSAGAA